MSCLTSMQMPSQHRCCDLQGCCLGQIALSRRVGSERCRSSTLIELAQRATNPS